MDKKTRVSPDYGRCAQRLTVSVSLDGKTVLDPRYAPSPRHSVFHLISTVDHTIDNAEAIKSGLDDLGNVDVAREEDDLIASVRRDGLRFLVVGGTPLLTLGEDCSRDDGVALRIEDDVLG